jgi:anti-anti-sigma factor
MDEIPGASFAGLNALCGTATDDDDMALAVLRDGETVTVAVNGEIDLMTVARLSETVSSEMAKSPKVLVVDLDGVGFLASMGITALALAERDARDKGIDFRVVASSRATLRPLAITGMTDQLAVYASRADAVSGAARGPGSPARSQQAN